MTLGFYKPLYPQSRSAVVSTVPSHCFTSVLTIHALTWQLLWQIAVGYNCRTCLAKTHWTDDSFPLDFASVQKCVNTKSDQTKRSQPWGQGSRRRLFEPGWLDMDKNGRSSISYQHSCSYVLGWINQSYKNDAAYTNGKQDVSCH